ncbi:family 43 glycosylhydrolase [Microbacterium sp. BK668]|uniref:family 43 glycosylhydrolase n=1 Tax=Microbacterium sp. BK668 TaxID=2512118 RepID=UPI00105EBC9A|nr:family 43 glycosylhydrolase [Microbacterium sp. BK668]TDN91729.1 GH43 family beta-xylosidase [Microbacterium sp. BK668]
MATKSWRRLGVTGAAIAALTVGVLAPTAAHADPVPDDPNIVLHYDFSTAGAVKDVSGHNNDGTIVGTGVTVANGELTLPGGASNSGAGYVRFPAGIFDGKNTLTISTWLRNDTGAGNYAAMFFGSTANPPAQYWLLNPRNPSGRFKTVITNGSAPTAPWGTEYGISPTTASQGIAGPTTGTAWSMYTTVVTPTSISGYYNGALVGTVATTRTISQFGTGLVGYIGRSSYPDIFYKGGVDDVIVSTSAYSAGQIAELYHLSDRTTAAQTDAALAADADAVSLPSEATADLTLPTTGTPNLSRITWASSHPSVIGADGKVTRPAEGQPDASVVLTGTFTLAGQSITRDFAVTVPAVNPQGDLERTADAFDLGIKVAAGDIVLNAESQGAAISWASSAPGVISTTGAVTRAAADQQVALTATFSRAGHITTRTYDVTVKAQDVGQAVAYVRTGNTAKTEVLHLAAAKNGDPLVALNNNKGVLYPAFGSGTSQFANPTLFRKPDGTYGLVAADNAANGRIFVYSSKDLVTFTDQKLVLTNTQNIVVSRADVKYDNGSRLYRVTLRTAGDAAYEVTTSDFTTFSAPVSVTASAAPTLSGLPTGAIEASALAITQAELTTLQKALGRIVNTSVDAGDDVSVDVNGSLDLPDKVDLGYSDGSSKQLGVDWDTSSVDLTKPGEYTVTGTVNQPVYGDDKGILVKERADPWVFRDDERTGSTEYYLTGSYPTTQANAGVGYDRIVLRRADTINGLTTAQEQVLLWANNAASPDTSNGSKIATSNYRYFWAPELHKINGDWYIFFTSSRSTDVWNIRPTIMRAPGNTDPMVASNWSVLGYVKAAAGDTAAFTSFSLDMTHFEANGKHYLVWAEKPGTSDLRMAEINPNDPTQLTTKSILLSTPNYAWERTTSQVINEGPAVIKSDEEVFVFFSASEVNETYSIGMLRAPIGGDLMNPATWAKTGYPLLTSDDFGGQQNGPGHNSFTLDENGNPVIVYHARPPVSEWIPGADGGLNDPSRHARVKTVHFAADGSAVLNQTREEELAPQNRTVTLNVTVVGPPEPQLAVSASVAARCVAGKVVQAVTVTNAEGFPVTLTASGAYGTKAFGSVAAGKSVSATFTTRLGSIPSGALTLKATATVDGKAVEVEKQIAYSPAFCS